MHKGKGSFKSHAIKAYQNNLKRINQRKVSSIWDIINDQTLGFRQKVNYIRHHYVYYDGNYDLFYDENKQPTTTKHLLDKVIAGVINKTIDPSELSDINKVILQEHKIKVEQLKRVKEANLDVYLREQQEEQKEQPKVVMETLTSDEYTYKQGIVNADIYFQLIDEYLANLPEKERVKASQWKYKELKKVAKWWVVNNRPSLLKAEKIPKRTKQQAMNELLAGYKKYAEKNWKN